MPNCRDVAPKDKRNQIILTKACGEVAQPMLYSLAVSVLREAWEMESIRVVHLQHNSAEVVIIPIRSIFGQLRSGEKQKVITEFQLLAAKSGLSGVVVPVWDCGNGTMDFIAPAPWHPFFSRITLRHVAARLNSEICWQ